jgi:hypothetical protein
MGVVVPEYVNRVRVHPSVEHIPEDAFKNRTALVEVELHDGLLTIGAWAFYDCTLLLRINIPSSVTEICDWAFMRCTSLREVNLAEGLRSIGNNAFMECTSLLRIKIPSSVTAINYCAFYNCTSLTEVDLAEGLQTIGYGAFQDCTSLLRIMIPSSVTDIGERAFQKCISLKEVNLTEGLQTVGDSAFRNCTSLLRINIPSSVMTIGHWAFVICTSLKEVNLAEGLQLIGWNAFVECDSLLRINIPSTVGEWRQRDSFYDSTLLRNVAIAPSSDLTQDMFAQSFRSLQNMGLSLEMIIGRFMELPLHKHCYYYRPQHRAEQTMDSTTWKWFNEEVGRLPAHGLQQDCFGMTPLHILLCSSAGCDVRVCQCMIEKYPGAMLIEDKWGEIPLVYALLGEAPIEVIHFLLESHMQRWQAMPFDFGGMILRLLWHTSADYVRDVIRAQRTHHRALEIDWHRIVDELIRGRRDIPIRMFSVLVEASVSKRSICMNDEHRIEVDARLREIEVEIEDEDDDDNDEEEEDGGNVQYYEEIHDMVTSYVRLHHGQLREAITILELALWKTMICSKVDDQESRSECRASGGRCLEVVIKHVLAFL